MRHLPNRTSVSGYRKIEHCQRRSCNEIEYPFNVCCSYLIEGRGFPWESTYWVNFFLCISSLWYITYLRCLDRTAIPRIKREVNSMTVSVRFMKNEVPENTSDMKKRNIMVVKTVTNIEVSKELSVAYDSCYIFAALLGVSRV